MSHYQGNINKQLPGYTIIQQELLNLIVPSATWVFCPVFLNQVKNIGPRVWGGKSPINNIKLIKNFLHFFCT